MYQYIESHEEANKVAYFASLVLRDLMVGVLLAVPALAVRATSLWDVDLSMHARQSYSRGFSSS